jgi:hypothetical protein
MSKPNPQAKNEVLTLGQLGRIKLVYAFALSFIALALVTSSVVMRYAISKNSADARVINLSGRQRMLSQRLTKATLALGHPVAPEVFAGRTKELSQSLQDWTRAHQGLQFGDPGLGLPTRASSRAISGLFAQATPYHEPRDSHADERHCGVLGDPGADAQRGETA